jgi:hypothetical protein
MRKGILGLSLEMVIAILVTAVVIGLIYLTSSGYGQKLLMAMREFACSLLPFLC